MVVRACCSELPPRPLISLWIEVQQRVGVGGQRGQAGVRRAAEVRLRNTAPLVGRARRLPFAPSGLSLTAGSTSRPLVPSGGFRTRGSEVRSVPLLAAAIAPSSRMALKRGQLTIDTADPAALGR